MGLLKKKSEQKHDWRNFDNLPSRVVTKEELDRLQKEVVAEIEATLEDGIAKSDLKPEERNEAKPQALYYCYKYIDSKFNKNDFDIDSYYHAKQNLLDQLYAEGLGEVEAELAEYNALLEATRDVEQRMRRKENDLDPESELDEKGSSIHDDSGKLSMEIASLPHVLNWQVGKEQ